MIMEMYSIKDTVTGLYSQPFFAQNQAAAIRQFDYLMSNAQMVAKDCQLYYIGDFDSEQGFMLSGRPTSFIKNAEVVENV